MDAEPVTPDAFPILGARSSPQVVGPRIPAAAACAAPATIPCPHRLRFDPLHTRDAPLADTSINAFRVPVRAVVARPSPTPCGAEACGWRRPGGAPNPWPASAWFGTVRPLLPFPAEAVPGGAARERAPRWSCRRSPRHILPLRTIRPGAVFRGQPHRSEPPGRRLLSDCPDRGPTVMRTAFRRRRAGALRPPPASPEPAAPESAGTSGFRPRRRESLSRKRSSPVPTGRKRPVRIWRETRRHANACTLMFRATPRSGNARIGKRSSFLCKTRDDGHSSSTGFPQESGTDDPNRASKPPR